MGSKATFESPASKAKEVAAWATAQRLGVFSYAQLANDARITLVHATHVTRAWAKEGRVRLQADLPRGSGRLRFEIVPGFKLPIEPDSKDSIDQMWTAMRKMGSFCATDIASVCAIGVGPVEAQAYCRVLLEADYLRVQKTAILGVREAIYRLARNSGPKAPRLKRVRAIIDANAGTVTPMSEGRA